MSGSNYKAIQKMDNNKSHVDSKVKKKNASRTAVHFVGDVKQELKRIDWTSKEELKSYTKIVVASTFFFGMFIYFIDLLMKGFLEGINLVVKFFTG